jgi:hypothetical protein
MLTALRAIEHDGSEDDPLADPDEGPDDVTNTVQGYQLSLPLLRR